MPSAATKKGREDIRQSNAAIHGSFYKDSVLRAEVLGARELVPGVIEQRAGLWKFTAAHNTRIVPPR
jgi:hypothetical protein